MYSFLATAILDFWQMSPLRDTGNGTIKTFDLENMGIAVGILLPPPSSCRQTSR